MSLCISLGTEVSSSEGSNTRLSPFCGAPVGLQLLGPLQLPLSWPIHIFVAAEQAGANNAVAQTVAIKKRINRAGKRCRGEWPFEFIYTSSDAMERRGRDRNG